MAETSTKPYLIRAIHEWCSDNGFTPYIAVAVDGRTSVPREFVRNGEIVLNVSVMATHRLQLGNELIEFQARFGGTPRELSIPVENVSAIYARENGHGMAFDVPKAGVTDDSDAAADSPADTPASVDGPRASATPKADDGQAGDNGTEQGAPRPVTGRTRPRATLRSARSAEPDTTSRPPQLVSVPAEPAASPPGEPPATTTPPDDDPPDPSDNPPKKSRPKLTRVK